MVLYDVQDNYTNPVEPTDSMTNPLYGSSFIDFTVSIWNGASFIVVAAITNNDLVKRTVTFPAVSTDRILVTVTRSADAYARLAEIEAWEVTGEERRAAPHGALSAATRSIRPCPRRPRNRSTRSIGRCLWICSRNTAETARF